MATSCKNTGNSAAKEMAGEMCKAMALINDDDPMSVVEAKAALSKIARNKEKYKHVTEEELLKAMQEMCPEGAARVIEIQSAK